MKLRRAALVFGMSLYITFADGTPPDPMAHSLQAPQSLPPSPSFPPSVPFYLSPEEADPAETFTKQPTGTSLSPTSTYVSPYSSVPYTAPLPTSSPDNAASTTSGAPLPTATLDTGTLADIDTVTQRRLSFVAASISDADHISTWLTTLDSDGKWPDSEVDYTSGCDARRANWPAQAHWRRILTMSAAWHGGVKNADQYVKDPALLEAISRAMNWWFDNDFTNPACLDRGGQSACPCGTPGLWNTNWYSNVILIPSFVSRSCLLLNDSLTPSQLESCTHITSRSYSTLGTGAGYTTGANLLDISTVGIDLGLLSLNASLVADAYGNIHREAVIQDAVAADGIRADGSFGQHNGIIYNGNYGKDFLNDLLELEVEAGGTQFAAGTDTRHALETLLDGDRWMIYRNVLTGVLHWDFSVLGRFISFPVIDAQATGSVNLNLSEVQQLGQAWNSEVLTSFATSLSENCTNANAGNIQGNRMFFANDYMVQRGPGYATTLRMYSNRTRNTECTNSQNPLGFHLSDGTLYTYMQGDEYEDIAAAWDWNMIAGTTVDYDATPLSCDQTGFNGVESFVGGVSDGHSGAAAMRYTNPITESLTWQKAWFFLEDDVQHVMISYITSSTTASVFSVLDQKRHNDPVLVDGFPLGEQTNFSNPQSLWHDNVGYLFDTMSSPVQLSVEFGPRTGNWADIGISKVGDTTVDIFAAWLDHSSDSDPFTPVSYTVFPAVDPEAFLRKTLSTRLHTIRNDQNISAVFDDVHRTAMIVFWNEAGGSTSVTPGPQAANVTITSSGNAAVLYRLDAGEVTVSDPSQTLANVELTFTIDGLGGKPAAWGPGCSTSLTFELPMGGLTGSSVSQKLC